VTTPGGGGDRLDVEVVADASGFARGLQAKIDAQTRNVRAKIRAELDAARLQQQLAAQTRLIERTTRIKIRAEVDGAYLRQSMDRAMAGLSNREYKIKVGVDVDTNRVQRAMDEATRGGRKANVKVDADTSEARTETDKFVAEANRKKATIKVKVEKSGLDEAKKALDSIGKVGMVAGAIQAVTSGVMGLAAALISVVSAASQAGGVLGALPNLIGAGLQGIGAMVLGFSGVGDAVKAMGAAQTKGAGTAASSARAQVEAARRIEDANKALQRAQQDADRTAVSGARDVAAARQRLADAQESASASIVSAERQVVSAQQERQRAQEDLNRAIKDATQQLHDYQLQLSGAALDEEAATLAVERARERLDQVNRSPGSSQLDRSEADLGVRQALQSLAEIKDRNQQLQAQAADAYKKGVSGADNVVAAQQKVADANQNVQDAEQNLAKTRVDAARSVADAQANLQQTIADTAQANADAAQKVADAQEGVARALEDNRLAAEQTTSAQTALNAAMANLSPAGARFANFINSTLKPRFLDLKKAIQEALLPGVQLGVEKALPLLDTLKTGLVGTAGIIGGFTTRLGTMMGSPLFRGDVATIMASNNRAIGSFSNAGLSLVTILRNLAVAAGPLLERFAKWIEKIAAAGAAASTTGRETGKLEAFFQRAGDRAAQLGRIFGNLIVSLFNIGKASSSTGEGLLNTLEKVTARWRAWTGSDEGQAKMQSFFAAMAPIGEQILGVVNKLIKTFVLLGQDGGGSLGGFLTMLGKILDAVNWLLASPFGPFISALLTIAGYAGALAFVGSKILGIGKAFTALGGGIKILGGLSAGLQGGASAAALAGNKWGQLGSSIGMSVRIMGQWTAMVARNAWASLVSGASSFATKMGEVATALASGVKQAALWLIQQGRIVATNVASAISGMASSFMTFVRGLNLGAVAAKAMAAAQWLLNIAMDANPIGLLLLAIAALVAAFIWAWNNIDGFKEGVTAVMSAIGDFFVMIWTHVRDFFVGVWNAIWSFFATILGNIRDFFVGVWQGIVDFFTMVTNGIYTVAMTVWNAIVAFFTGVWNFIVGIFTGAWNGITTGLSAAWSFIQNVATTVWNAIVGFFQNTWNFIVGIFQGAVNFLQGLWNGFWNVISSVATTVFGAVRDWISGVLDGIGNAFRNVVNVISGVWDALKTIIRAPIEAIVNVVYDHGIVPVWNWINNLWGGEDLPEWHVPNFATGGVLDARRGGVSRGYAPGKDSIWTLSSPGEGYLVPEAVVGLGGPSAVQAINSQFSGRVPGPGLGGGGVQDGGDGVPSFFLGGVLDTVGGWVKSGWDWTTDKIGDAVGTVSSLISKGWQFAVHAALSPIHGLISTLFPSGNMVTEGFGKAANSWLDKVEAAVTGKEKEDQAKKAAAATAAAGSVGGGTAQWAGLVSQVLGELGQPTSLTPWVLQIIQHESGGNPRAINLTDSNALAGHPSQGLMQTIPSTFQAYAGPYAGAGIYDPHANIYAGINYGIHRYGSVANIPGVKSLMAGGAYKPYDSGGRLRPGHTNALNMTGEDEAVLTPHAIAQIGGWGPIDALNAGQSLATALNQGAVTSASGALIHADVIAGAYFADGAIRMTAVNPTPEPASSSLNAGLRRAATFGIFPDAPVGG
jgi:phage-related protein